MFDLNELKDKIAVIGVGNTKYGNFPEIDDYGLAAQAFRNAVKDCGIDKNKIDGLLVSPHSLLRAHGRGARHQPALDALRCRRMAGCPAWASSRRRPPLPPATATTSR